MRLGARENADQGILLAATTEHFLPSSFLEGRLSANELNCYLVMKKLPVYVIINKNIL